MHIQYLKMLFREYLLIQVFFIYYFSLINFSGSRIQNNMNQLYENHAVRNSLEKAQKFAIFLASVDTFEKSKALLNQLAPQQKICFIDRKQSYALVQGPYLKQLIRNSQEGSVKLTKATQQLFEYANKATYFQTTLELTNQELKKSKQNQRILLQQLNQRDLQIQGLVQKLKNKMDQIDYIQKNIQSLRKPRKQKDRVVQRQNENIFSKKQFNTQTEHIPQIMHEVQLMDIEESKQSINQNKGGLDDIQLKLVFKNIINDLTQKFEQKIAHFKLKDDQLNEWKQKCERISRQNEQIKKRIQDIATEQEKVKIWKESVFKFIDRVENEYISKKQDRQKMVQQPNPDMLYDKQEKIRKLQRKVIQNQVQRLNHQQRLKKINKILTEENVQPADQGALNNLLKISVKIRQALKILMESM